MVGGDIFKSVGFHRAHISAVGKYRVDVVTSGGIDTDSDILTVGGFRNGRGHRAAVTRRRRHTIFVDGKLGGNRVAATHIRKRVGICGFHWFVVHTHLRQMPARGRRKRIGGVVAAEHRRRADRRNRAFALNRSRDFVIITYESGRQCVGFRHIIECMGRIGTHITTVGEHRINMVAIIGGNCNGLSSTIFHNSYIRRDTTTDTCHRRDFVTVTREQWLHRVVARNIFKTIVISGLQRITIHNDGTDEITRIRLKIKSIG